MKPTDYIPIDCGLHSEYELLIMQHRSCRLGWHAASGTLHMQIATPTDLCTRNGEEFMVVNDAANQTHEIRLDRIQYCTPV